MVNYGDLYDDAVVQEVCVVLLRAALGCESLVWEVFFGACLVYGLGWLYKVW